MVSVLPRIEVILNKTIISTALIDSGCDTFALISDRLVQKLQVERIPIAPRPVQKATAHSSAREEIRIEWVAHFNMDIDGHQRGVFAYVIPGLRDDVILGIPWMELEEAVLEPRKKVIKMKFAGIEVGLLEEKGRKKGPRIESTDLREVSATGFTVCHRRLFKEGGKEALARTVCAISLEDINKALKPKVKGNPYELLPPVYHQYLSVFDPAQGKALPPHREGVDYEIWLEKDQDGKEKSPPWGPLYGMSKDKLLVLRKTLMELMD